MVRLDRLLTEDSQVELYGKLEALNPGGSVKDRIGVAMIEAAEAQGRIEPGRTTIVEATSGNTGIALAFVCAARGYDLVLTLPQGMSRERAALLRMYGARVEEVESMGGMDEAVQAARAMASQADVFLPDQFSNPANPEIHRRTTGPEILDALDGRVDVLVAGVGTGGTITGAGRCSSSATRRPGWWRWSPPAPRCCPASAAGPHRIQGIGAGFVPAVLEREVIDEVIAVSDEDAIETARLLARRQGVLAGISCGAAAWAALEVAGRPGVGGPADRGRAARFRRALHVDAVLRAVSRARSRVARLWACSEWARWRAWRGRCAMTSPRRASATPPPGAWGRGRSWPPGRACMPCSPTASRTPCTTPVCRSCPGRWLPPPAR